MPVQQHTGLCDDKWCDRRQCIRLRHMLQDLLRELLGLGSLQEAFPDAAPRRALAPMPSQLPRCSASPGHWYPSSRRALPALIQNRLRQRRAWQLDWCKGRFGTIRGPWDGRENTLRQHLLIRAIILCLLSVDQQRAQELLWRTPVLLGQGEQ